MMRKFFVLLMIMSLATFFGCNSDTNGINNEEININEEIKSVIEDSLDLYFDGLDDYSEDNFLTDEPNWMGGTGLVKATEKKVRFGRIKKRPVERSIQIINDTDSTATAYLYIKFEGEFVVHKFQRDEDTTAINRYAKPLSHEIERVIHLKKIRNTESIRRNWKIVDISFADGESPMNDVQIEQLTIMAAGIDTVVIDDPLAYFMNGADMFIFPRFTEVKLRVKVRNNTANPVIYPENTRATENVRLHYGRNRLGHFARSNFEWVEREDELNVYEGTWIVRQFRGMHHAVIDVIDNGTIYEESETDYPYISNTWASPYRVTVF